MKRPAPGEIDLRAPFPWFGGKSRVASLVWERFGEVRNYVEPFAGSLAVLLNRPTTPGIETVNDLDCLLANFWRALQHDPEGVAKWADNPVNEADQHARHLWLCRQEEFRERMKVDPDYYDVKIAGWWVWGQCIWIGSGWCARQLPHLGDAGKGVHRKLPHLGNAGTGVHRQLPHLGDAGKGSGLAIASDLTSGTRERAFLLGYLQVHGYLPGRVERLKTLIDRPRNLRNRLSFAIIRKTAGFICQRASPKLLVDVFHHCAGQAGRIHAPTHTPMLPFLKGLMFLCVSAFLAAVAWLGVEAVYSLRAITSSTVKAETSIATSAAELPRVANERLIRLQLETLKLVDTHLGRIEGIAAETATNLDARLGSITEMADRQLAEANHSISRISSAASTSLPIATASVSQALGGIAADVHQVAVPAASVAAQVADAAPMYLDCDPATGGGQDCIFNRFQGISKATEQSAQAIAKAAPQIAESVAGMAADGRREADELTRPKNWHQKLTAYLLLAGELAAHLL